jgi:hypothetical protein
VGQAIGSVLTFAVGVAISPLPVIAVILMLFSGRARVNGPAFLVGWVAALTVVSTAVYLASDAGSPASGSTASATISWVKVALGIFLLAAGARRWRHRPGAGEEAPLPRWMAGIDTVTPVKAFGLGVLLAGVNPKNLVLTVGAAAGLAQIRPSVPEVVVALGVFVVIASLTIAGPVAYFLVGGEVARTRLDDLKDWLRLHNAAVMAVLFVVFGVDLVAKGLPH